MSDTPTASTDTTTDAGNDGIIVKVRSGADTHDLTLTNDQATVTEVRLQVRIVA